MGRMEVTLDAALVGDVNAIKIHCLAIVLFQGEIKESGRERMSPIS